MSRWKINRNHIGILSEYYIEGDYVCSFQGKRGSWYGLCIKVKLMKLKRVFVKKKKVAKYRSLL